MINVIWYNAARGNWDSGLLCSIFDKHPDLFPQHNDKKLLFCKRAIIIVVGRPEVVPLREYLNSFDSGIVILTSEEDSYFDWKAAVPPYLEVWTQYYSANKSEIKERLLLGAPNRIKDYKINTNLPKKYLWSFVGQVQNPFRQACVEAAKKIPDGYLHIAGAFGGQVNGVDYQEYLDIMCQSKFVLCPAGSMSADSFRVYEAMECGAIPIADIRAPRDPENFNYWTDISIYCRLIQVTGWNDKFVSWLINQGAESYLNETKPENIGLTQIQSRNYWWNQYKNVLEQKLISIANEN